MEKADMNIERRKVLKSIGLPFLATLAAAVGLLKHSVSFSAEWNKSLFENRDPKAVLLGVVRGGQVIPNTEITIKLPAIAENASTVEVEITSNIENTTRITLMCDQLDFPMIADFMLSNGAQGYIVTRINLRPSCRLMTVRAIVHTSAYGQVYSAVREVYLTQSGCGGDM